ncbi:MAG: response regulator transcription factor [Erysipelotrichaceae bacterium]|nr:response regulator transcription factor [Erysipelotrichaceae bacterium]
MVKVLIADDQMLIQESLNIILSSFPDIQITETVGNGIEVIESVKHYRPDIVLMDIRMPQMDGVTCTKILKEHFPDVKIIVLTTFDDDEYIFKALKYGASGYLLKGVTRNELHQAIMIVSQGGAMMNPDIMAKITQLFSRMAKSSFMIDVDESAVKHLSNIELRTIQQVAMGLSNKEIASKLCLSEGTVRNYISNVLNKLNLRGRTQLAIWAVQTGIATADYSE